MTRLECLKAMEDNATVIVDKKEAKITSMTASAIHLRYIAISDGVQPLYSLAKYLTLKINKENK